MSYTVTYVTRVRLECDGCGKVAEFERRSEYELPSGWRVFDLDLDQTLPPQDHVPMQTIAVCSRACLHSALLKRAQSAWSV